jgi:hypothetical protein
VVVERANFETRIIVQGEKGKKKKKKKKQIKKIKQKNKESYTE